MPSKVINFNRRKLYQEETTYNVYSSKQFELIFATARGFSAAADFNGGNFHKALMTHAVRLNEQEVAIDLKTVADAETVFQTYWREREAFRVPATAMVSALGAPSRQVNGFEIVRVRTEQLLGELHTTAIVAAAT